MENKDYYDILGVSVKASIEEITAAKNELAKRYHPDANIKNGIDTTLHMQEILEAYQILSDPAKRTEYDREITGRTAQMRTFDLKNNDSDKPQEDLFVTYWKAAGELHEIILQSDGLYRHKEERSHLAQLALQAIKYILILREGQIPEKYWHPDIMNWLLFTWYKNRNITIAYLLTLHDEYMKERATTLERLKLQNKSYRYQHSVKRLVKY